MKDFPGAPGTLTGLLLRISQCVFAAGSIASMATTASFFNFTAFCYLIASMGLQVIWSLVLALLDAYSLVKKKVLHNPVLVSLFVVGDWVTATLSLAAASASAGITVLYFSDLSHCNFGEECQKYQMAVALAYLSWVCVFVECGVGIGLQQIKPSVSFKAVFSEIDGPSYCGISGSKLGCKRSVSVYQQKLVEADNVGLMVSEGPLAGESQRIPITYQALL